MNDGGREESLHEGSPPSQSPNDANLTNSDSGNYIHSLLTQWPTLFNYHIIKVSITLRFLKRFIIVYNYLTYGPEMLISQAIFSTA